MTGNSERTVLNDRYEITQRIGRGGMADVFLARDLLLDRPVAIKVLFPEFATDPNFVERFRREAQAAANLNHPNIVSVYDWGKYLNTYFMAMEYVEGRTLADVVRANGHINSVQAAEIASEVSAALGFAHRNGVVHRDIKPANILIGGNGQVKVADFGIARAMNAPTESNLTQVGAVMGTATYFSPEQAQGAQPDPRSDLYSLGIVLYEMVSGRPPFTGDNPVGIAYKQVHDAPQPLNQLVADIPRPFEAIVAKLLAKNPAQRYPDADALREDLRRFRHNEPVLALGPPPQPRQQASRQTVAGPATGAQRTTAMARTTAMPTAAATTAMARATVPQRAVVVDHGYPPQRNRNGAYAVAAFIAVLALAVGGFFLFRALKHDSSNAVKTLVLPDLTNKTLEDAQTALNDLNLSFTPDPQPTDKVAEGIVYATKPLAGETVQTGQAITLTFNPVAELIAIPTVDGQPLEEAAKALTAAQFNVNPVNEASTAIEKGKVIRTEPAGGQQAKQGSTVNVVVSAGPDTVTVPQLANQTQATAQAALAAEPYGFKVTVEQQPSATVAAGNVIGTDPAASTSAPKGGPIKLIVSSGPAQVSVPKVEDLAETDARTALRSANLQVSVTYITVPFGSRNDGIVISQTPTAGTNVDPGTTVSLKIGKAVVPPSTTTTTTTLPPATTTTKPPPTTTTAAPTTASPTTTAP